jgi:nicotinic acid mononucleotide adenylyltransferase
VEEIMGKQVGKQVALMGGTFDPVHMGHLKVAQCIYDELHFEKIVFLPAAYSATQGWQGLCFGH